MIKERILNKGDRFHYFLCSRCQTLQLADSVEDIGYFYSNYRVFQNTYQPEKKNMYQKAVWQLKMKWFLNMPLSERMMREGDSGI